MDPISLAALAIKAAPAIGRFLGFPETVTAVENTIASIFGTTDKATVDAKIAANPELYVQLQIRLAEVAAQREKDERQAELDNFRAEIQDRMDARARDVAMTAAGRANVRANIMVAGAFATLIACLAALVVSAWKTWSLTGETIAIIMGISGTAGTLLASAFNFEFGTSRGSQSKDATIQALAKNGHG